MFDCYEHGNIYYQTFTCRVFILKDHNNINIYVYIYTHTQMCQNLTEIFLQSNEKKNILDI